MHAVVLHSVWHLPGPERALAMPGLPGPDAAGSSSKQAGCQCCWVAQWSTPVHKQQLRICRFGWLVFGKKETPGSLCIIHGHHQLDWTGLDWCALAAGTQAVIDVSQSAITVLSFANIRNDLLAFGNSEGDLWLAELQGSSHTLRKVGMSLTLSSVFQEERAHVRWCPQAAPKH